MLTDIVYEVLEDSSRDTLVAHGIAEKLRHQLNSKAFSLGIVRLIRHEHHRSGHKVSDRTGVVMIVDERGPCTIKITM